MTTHETIAGLRFFTHKFARRWGVMRVRADVAGKHEDVLLRGYVASPLPHILFSVCRLPAPYQVARVIDELSLYERKTIPVFVEVADGDVREITGVTADENRKLLLLTVPA